MEVLPGYSKEKTKFENEEAKAAPEAEPAEGMEEFQENIEHQLMIVGPTGALQVGNPEEGEREETLIATEGPCAGLSSLVALGEEPRSGPPTLDLI